MIDYRAATLRKRRQRVRDRCGMAMLRIETHRRDEEWLSVALIIQRKNRETSYPTSPVSRAIRKAGRRAHATS